MPQPTKVVVLGGGYVAITVCRSLKKAIASGEVEVTVVSRQNYHAWHGYISEMITGRIAPGQILSPARRIFKGANVHVGEITKIDLEAKRVYTTRHLDGRPYELAYDHLVFGLGSAENYDAYPGLAEHAFKLKNWSDCFRLKNHIITMFELADIETDPDERRRLLTFFVAGGGYAGTELAGELADYCRLLTSREYPKIKREECRVVLVHPGKTILPELGNPGNTAGYESDGHPKLVAFATKHLTRLGAEIKTDTRVRYATPSEVGLSTGERVPTRTIVSAVGTKPAPLLDTITLPRADRGRVQVEASCRVVGFENVWAAGDCAAVPHPSGGICPPVGLMAMAQGYTLGANILRQVRGQQLKPFKWKGLGQGVSIGRRTAVGEAKGMEFTGLPAWLVWRFLSFWYFPSWDRKLRLLWDWLVWPIVGRDIVEMNPGDSDDYELSHHRYQPGEEILAAGRADRYVYLITEGTVLVDGPEGQSRLGPGQHFGMTGSDFHVVAETEVKALAVREDQVARLKQVLGALAQVTA